MANILLLEDDIKMASEIKLFLTNQGHSCETVSDGLLFFKFEQNAKFDLFILDINVPGLNGMQVCKKMRKSGNKAPILILTAYSEVADKVQAFEYGADDYLVKPFHFDELMARIKALLRRITKPVKDTAEIYSVADLVINASDLTVTRGGKPITLTPKEYKLLELLASAKGKYVSKQIIAEQVWDINFETGTNTIEVYINFLRNKIDKGNELQLIHTRPGYGYYLKETK
jgi:DNA-binding response OmpR family regulator